MKKQDFKKLASMGLACGVLLSGQASAIDLNSAETVLAGAGCHQAAGHSCTATAYRNVPSNTAGCGVMPGAAMGQGQNPEVYTQWETTRGGFNAAGCGSPSMAPGQPSSRYMSDTGKSMNSSSSMQGQSSTDPDMDPDANPSSSWNKNSSQPMQRGSSRTMNSSTNPDTSMNSTTNPNSYMRNSSNPYKSSSINPSGSNTAPYGTTSPYSINPSGTSTSPYGTSPSGTSTSPYGTSGQYAPNGTSTSPSGTSTSPKY